MKKGILVLLVISSMIVLVGCKKKDTDTKDSKKAYASVAIGEKTYVEQLSKIKIEGTKDYFKITEKVKWEVPEEADEDTTVSFVVAIPYVINVDGVDYEGIYTLGNSDKATDENPKYTFEVTNLTNEYEIEVLINKK